MFTLTRKAAPGTTDTPLRRTFQALLAQVVKDLPVQYRAMAPVARTFLADKVTDDQLREVARQVVAFGDGLRPMIDD